jgi:hypothetical protein
MGSTTTPTTTPSADTSIGAAADKTTLTDTKASQSSQTDLKTTPSASKTTLETSSTTSQWITGIDNNYLLIGAGVLALVIIMKKQGAPAAPYPPPPRGYY